MLTFDAVALFVGRFNTDSNSIPLRILNGSSPVCANICKINMPRVGICTFGLTLSAIYEIFAHYELLCLIRLCCVLPLFVCGRIYIDPNIRGAGRAGSKGKFYA